MSSKKKEQKLGTVNHSELENIGSIKLEENTGQY